MIKPTSEAVKCYESLCYQHAIPTLPRRASSRWSPTATNNLAPCRGRQFAENFIPKMMGRKEKVGSFYLNMAYMAVVGIYVRFLGIISIGNTSEPTIDFHWTFVRFPGSIKSNGNKWKMQTFSSWRLVHQPSWKICYRQIGSFPQFWSWT